MLSFDSPEFKALTKRDDQFLANCKIDWESKLLSIAKEIMECREFLSERDVHKPQTNCDNNIDEYSAEEIECIRRIEEKKEEKELRLVLKERYTQKLRIAEEQLETLINNIQNIDRNTAIETLANDMKNWKEHEMTNEEKETFPDQYPWEHVALSLLKCPEKVIFDYDHCPKCGQSRIRLFFYSPEWTWAMMCGVGGDMTVCPQCKVQAEFVDRIRN